MADSNSPCSPLIDVESDHDGLKLCWADNICSTFHLIWLRDNCRCRECGDPAVGRRSLRLSQLRLDDIANTRIDENDHLVMHWPDGHISRFSGYWLREHAYDEQARRRRSFTPTLWTDVIRNSIPSLNFDAVMEDDGVFHDLLCAVRDYGLCLVTDAPTDAGTLEPLATKIGPPQQSNFGRVQDMLVDHAKRSVANRTVGLKPHTDEPYRASPPGLILFHCIETDVTGAGESIFLDGFEAAEVVRREDPAGFAALTGNNHCFRRFFTDDVDLIAEFPVISVDEFGHIVGVRVNDRVAAPLAIPGSQVATYYRAYQRFLQLCEDPERTMKLALCPGHIVVFDNHRILHGRTQLTLKKRRWLQWIQVERGDFHSALRINADRLQRRRDALPLLRGAYG